MPEALYAPLPEPVAYALRFPSDTLICLSTVFDTRAEAQDYLEKCSEGTEIVPLYADATCSLRGGQQGWRPISEAPEGELLVVGWLDTEDTENPERYHFDWLEDGAWMSHEDAREHFLMCAPPGSRGPKEAAPYTHFMRLGRIPPPPPSTHPQETHNA